MAPGRLAIMRHGKAKPDSPTGRDADRPLAPRGERQAEWMGGELAAAGFRGARVLSSPADRTWSTAIIVAGLLETEPTEDDRLFLNGSVASVFDLLTESAADGPLVLVGHNPTISLAASVLTHGIGACAVSLRTGAAAVCDGVDTIAPGAATLRGVWRLAEK